MISFFKKNILILIGIILFLTGFVLIRMNKYDSKPMRSILSINKNIHSQFKKMSIDMIKVKQVIQNEKRLSFYKLNSIGLAYPFYVFRNKQILYWSDHRWIPTYNQIQSNEQYTFYQTGEDQFLIARSSVRIEKDVYTIFVCLPIYGQYSVRNKYFLSGYNQELLKGVQDISYSFDKKWGYNIYNPQAHFLFSVSLYEDSYISDSIQYWILSFFILGGLSILLYIYFYVRLLERRGKYWKAFFVVVVSLFILRFICIYFNFPFSIFSSELFSKKINSYYFFFSSIGDLFFNLIAILICFLFLTIYYSSLRNSISFNYLKKIKWIRFLLLIWAILSSFLILFLYYVLAKSIFEQLHLIINPAIYIHVSLIAIVGILCIFLASFSYLVFIDVVLKWLTSFLSRRKIIFFFLLVSILVSLSSYFWFSDFLVIGIGHIIYIVVILYLDLIKPSFLFRYYFFIYLLTGIIFTSLAVAYYGYLYESNRSLEVKKDFARSLLVKDNISEESILRDVIPAISQDTLIYQLLLQESVSDLLQEKIYRDYFIPYIDRYEIALFLFDKKGVSLDKSYSNSYTETKKIVLEDAKRIEESSIFFIQDKEIGNQYIGLLHLKKLNKTIGYIIIELQRKRNIPHSIYPELLASRRLRDPLSEKKYNYAIYEQGRLVVSFGNYNYLNYIKNSHLQSPDLVGKGIILNGLHHRGVKGPNDKIAIVSSPIYGFKDIFSIFSFFFVSFLLPILFIVFGYIIYVTFYQPTFSLFTKIQFYLTISFIIPLLVLSVVILSVVSSDYQQKIKDSFIKDAENVVANITPQVDQYINKKTSRTFLSKMIYQIVNHSQLDINLFSTNGRLIFSSQPYMYEKSILSSFINPVALSTITELRNKSTVVNESIGNLSYSTVYVAITSFRTGDLLGIVGIPFFDSQIELDMQRMHILTTFMNVFTIVFLLLLVVFYIVSNVLTIPLRLIKQRIKDTSLAGDNEPLVYYNQDEIGLLVNEYNKMLIKLEESKKILSDQEKEMAWREMAQQVAHEIKNPLTPMKLILQHLKRVLIDIPEELKKISSKSIDTLLEQVDSLSAIATSFSDFARMPEMEYKKFDLSTVLLHVIELYKINEQGKITYSIKQSPCWIIGDEQLMQRIFSNIITNAFEAISEDTKATIKIDLMVSSIENRVIISIQDNGKGISSDVQDKIFNPYFSTKSSGTGIGLAIAKRGIEQMNGKIYFQTEENKGTTFMIDLPLV